MFSFGHCPNHLTPPPLTPIRATWSFFFGSQNSRFESQFRTKNTIYTIWYTVYMQPKKQLKVQYIGIFEEIDSFYWPKVHFLKKGQKIRAWVDPHSGNARKKTFFSIDVFPKLVLHNCQYFVIKWGYICLVAFKHCPLWQMLSGPV